MITRVANLRDRLMGSFWFLPTLMLFAAIVLGVLLPVSENKEWISVRGGDWLRTTPAGARNVLSVIAGAMITVAGVVFSVTMVTLSIASSQFGSRVLRHQLRNRATQMALGAFLGTTVYCLLLLLHVEDVGSTAFVPHLSVLVGIGLAVASTFVLIYFIHDVAESVRAPHVVARVAADLTASIDRLFPTRVGESSGDDDTPAIETVNRLRTQASDAVLAKCEGYLQAVDGAALMDSARDHDWIVHLQVCPGDFLMLGDPVARLWARPGEVDKAAGLINGALIVGTTRTSQQDVNCAIHELVQMAVRALSPGVNDPFTAMNVIDRLAAALAQLAQREIPSPLRSDGEGKLRVIAHGVTFADAMAAAFTPIRQHTRSAPAVAVRLLQGLRGIGEKTRRQADRETVRQQAFLIGKTMREGDHLPEDLEQIGEQIGCVEETLSGKTEPNWRRDLPTSSPRAAGFQDDKSGQPNGEVYG